MASLTNVILIVVFFCSQVAGTREVVLFSSGVKVTIIVSPFLSDQHKLEYYVGDPEKGETDSPVLVKVDGSEFSGSDGSIPATEVASFRIFLEKQCYSLPKDSFRWLFNPALSSDSTPHSPSSVLQIKDGTLAMGWSGGDGAGGYNVNWKIDLKKRIAVRELWEFPESDEPKVDKFAIVDCGAVQSVQSPLSTGESEPKKDE